MQKGEADQERCCFYFKQFDVDPDAFLYDEVPENEPLESAADALLYMLPMTFLSGGRHGIREAEKLSLKE